MKIHSKNLIVICFVSVIFYSCSLSNRYTISVNSALEDVRLNENKILETDIGVASFYADEFNGRKTASGEIYNMNELTAAHPSYPFNTFVKVTNIKNGKSVEVRINDRMPNFKNRIVDLSLEAARKIDMINSGIQEVKVEVIKWGE